MILRENIFLYIGLAFVMGHSRRYQHSPTVLPACTYAWISFSEVWANIVLKTQPTYEYENVTACMRLAS